jgi:hypothetical protein
MVADIRESRKPGGSFLFLMAGVEAAFSGRGRRKIVPDKTYMLLL